MSNIPTNPHYAAYAGHGYMGVSQQCASLTEQLFPRLGSTPTWKSSGKTVHQMHQAGHDFVTNPIPVATFNFDGHYGPPSSRGGISGGSHTGICIGCSDQGLMLLEQYQGSGGAHVRFYSFAGGDTKHEAESASHYWGIAGT